MDQPTKKLRIIPGRLELPHVIQALGQTYTFAPDADLPTAYADALLRTHKDIFEEAKGKPDLKEYTFKKSWKDDQVFDVIKLLTDEQKFQVYEYALALKGGKTVDDHLDDMTISELQEFAEKKKIVIPGDVTKKADIIAFLRK